MQTVYQFQGGLTKGIASLGFSPSGNRLGGVAVDNDHSIAVYDTQVGSILSLDKGDTALIVDLKFKDDSVT